MHSRPNHSRGRPYTKTPVSLQSLGRGAFLEKRDKINFAGAKIPLVFATAAAKATSQCRVKVSSLLLCTFKKKKKKKKTLSLLKYFVSQFQPCRYADFVAAKAADQFVPEMLCFVFVVVVSLQRREAVQYLKH